METVANLILSLIGGGIAGALVTYLLQSRGKIVVNPTQWQTSVQQESSYRYTFRITAYNTALVPDGLADCRIVLLREGEELLVDRPKLENREGMHEMIFGGGNLPYRPPLSVIELPPRTPVYREIVGTLTGNEDFEKARQCDGVEFVGYSTSRGEVRTEIEVPSTGAFPEPEQD